MGGIKNINGVSTTTGCIYELTLPLGGRGAIKGVLTGFPQLRVRVCAWVQLQWSLCKSKKKRTTKNANHQKNVYFAVKTTKSLLKQ